MLNSGPINWCLKRQSIVALSSTKAKYIVLTLGAKKATWLQLLLIELRLLEPDYQHAQIKISNKNIYMQAINNNLDGIKPERASSTASLKGENKRSIALSHNPVFYARTKNINI